MALRNSLITIKYAGVQISPLSYVLWNILFGVKIFTSDLKLLAGSVYMGTGGLLLDATTEYIYISEQDFIGQF